MSNRFFRILVVVACFLLVGQAPGIADALSKEQFFVLSKRGHDLVMNQHYDRAFPILVPLARSPYADTRLFLDLADCYRQEWGQHEMQFGVAKDYCKKALTLNPNCGNAYDMLGQIASVQERHEEAVQLFTKALTLPQRAPVAMYHRAKSYASLHRYNEGLLDLDNYEKYLKAECPGDDHSVMADNVIRAQIYQDSGRYDQAIAAYKKSFPRFKTDWADNQILACMVKANHIPEAINELSNRIKKDGQDDHSYFMRAGLEVRVKKYREAIDDYTSAIAIDPTVTYYRDRAKAYELAGQPDLAKKDIEKSKIMVGR